MKIAQQTQSSLELMEKEVDGPTRCDVRGMLEKFKVVCTNSSHVRESNTDLDSGFQAMDSGFQVLDSLSLELGFGFSTGED